MGIKDRDFLSLMEKRTFAYEDRVALGTRSNFGWKEFTYKGIGLLSRKLATHLIYDLDTKKGQKLAILSESKPEYGACHQQSAKRLQRQKKKKTSPFIYI